LIYKNTKEVHEKTGQISYEEATIDTVATKYFGNVIIQILLIDLIFCENSILTVVVMTNCIEGALYIALTTVVISALVLVLFDVPLGNFSNENP
jgi:predicted tellurium resistance membrane protein TerC